MPIVTNYSGTIYNMGDYIVGNTQTNITPHIWYDQSRSYDSSVNVFNKLNISESLTLGDSEDDIWSYEEILEEIIKYLNLHIVQHGYDYYIFDWDTLNSANSIIWYDILTGVTKNTTINEITLLANNYGGSDTQISVADVFNQIQVKDNITKFEDVITSPFDDEQLIDLTAPRKYMIEYAANGGSDKAKQAFYDLIVSGVAGATDYDKADNFAYKKEWWIKARKNNNWSFMVNGDDCYDQLPIENGKYYNAATFAKYIYDTSFASGMLAFGSGEKFNLQNIQNIENITDYKDYIVINIKGNGRDESAKTETDPLYHTSINPPNVIYPDSSAVENCNMQIKYNYSVDGTYSSADPTVTNYLIFTGKLRMVKAQMTSGTNGFNRTISDGVHIPDWFTFERQKNTFNNSKTWVKSNSNIKAVVPSPDNERGMYYAQEYYKQLGYNSEVIAQDYDIYLSPVFDRGEGAKAFKYDIGKYSYYKNDVVPYVDVLACQMNIGNKYVEEYIVETILDGIPHAEKRYRWVTAEELMSRGQGEDKGYVVLSDGTIRYNAYFYLAINIDNGQYLIGDVHDFYNNIKTDMNLDGKGIAIPLPYEDHLSGALNITILGPVYNTWDDGIRRHPTWFRSEKLTQNYVSILPHIAQIWLEDFNIELKSDRGGSIDNGDDNDIIYMSDEQRTFINKKDDIEFNFTTALTANEAESLGVNITINRSDVVDSSGLLISQIHNNNTNEDAKPEQHYVDAYYREHENVKLIMESTLHDSSIVNPFNRYIIPYLSNKEFYLQSEEKNVRDNKSTVKIKETH